jgi:hypothetical protein
MMTWTRVHLESMDILQLRELKKHVDSILEKKIEQSQHFTEEEWGDILFEKELKIRKISDSMVNHGIVNKRTEIGKSRQSRPKNKNKRRNWKKYRGQGK